MDNARGRGNIRAKKNEENVSERWFNVVRRCRKTPIFSTFLCHYTRSTFCRKLLLFFPPHIWRISYFSGQNSFPLRLSFIVRNRGGKLGRERFARRVQEFSINFPLFFLFPIVLRTYSFTLLIFVQVTESVASFKLGACFSKFKGVGFNSLKSSAVIFKNFSLYRCPFPILKEFTTRRVSCIESPIFE